MFKGIKEIRKLRVQGRVKEKQRREQQSLERCGGAQTKETKDGVLGEKI